MEGVCEQAHATELAKGWRSTTTSTVCLKYENKRWKYYCPGRQSYVWSTLFLVPCTVRYPATPSASCCFLSTVLSTYGDKHTVCISLIVPIRQNFRPRSNPQQKNFVRFCRVSDFCHFYSTPHICLRASLSPPPRSVKYACRPLLMDTDSLHQNGMAYEAEGGVYFDVERMGDDYGALGVRAASSTTPDEAGGSNLRGKRSHKDFALWKRVKPGEPW